MNQDVFLLRFATMDGQDGELNEGVEEMTIQESDIKSAVQKANSLLKNKKSLHSIPFMPQLLNSEGVVIADTVAQPPYAHELIWIKGCAVGSQEPWVRV